MKESDAAPKNWSVGFLKTVVFFLGALKIFSDLWDSQGYIYSKGFLDILRKDLLKEGPGFLENVRKMESS